MQVSGFTMRGLARAILALALTAALASPAQADGGRVAITFDDVPGLTMIPEESFVEESNARLLAGLRRNHIPATGFVNEGKFDDLVPMRQVVILKEWLRAGMDLGNHTFSHESLNTMGPDAFIADIALGETMTRQLLAERGRRLRWFRHPYLETGATPAVRAQVDGWLATHGYRMAPASVDADDWAFSEPYDDALVRHDAARAAAVRAAYLAHTEAVIAWSRAASVELFGREIAFVMMLHDTRLNADCIDDLAAILRRQKLKPVRLSRAMRDPAYAIPDTYVGPEGIEWIERWATAMHHKLPWDKLDPISPDIISDYKRVDSERVESDTR